MNPHAQAWPLLGCWTQHGFQGREQMADGDAGTATDAARPSRAWAGLRRGVLLLDVHVNPDGL
jgi:hypothetical protein